MSHMTNKPTYENYGNITIEEFIDKVYEIGAMCVLPDVFYTLINHRHDYRTECIQAMQSCCTKKMIKAYNNMMVCVRVLTSV